LSYKKKIFIISSALLAVLVFLVGFLPQQQKFLATFLVFFIAAVISFISLRFGIKLSNLLPVLSLPVLFSVASSLVFVFFPTLSIIFKSAFAILVGISFYFILIALNVFLVVEQREKAFPLIRPAQVVLTILDVFAAFLIITAIYKSQFNFLIQSVVLFMLIFGLSKQFFWAQNLELSLKKKFFVESTLASLLVFEVASALSFVPIESFFRSLIITSVFYVNLGFFQHLIRHSLTKRIMVEYGLVVVIVVFLSIIL